MSPLAVTSLQSLAVVFRIVVNERGNIGLSIIAYTRSEWQKSLRW